MIKIYDYDKISLDDIFAREEEDTSRLENTVAQIIENVRKNGDNALLEYAEKFDIGPTIESPGPILFMQVSVAEKFVVKSKPSIEIINSVIAKTTAYIPK